MPALLYLIGAVFLGDFFSRRFLVFESVRHRAASAVLVGLLFSTCISYLAALAASSTVRPLFWSNLLFFLLVAVLVLFETGALARVRESFRDPDGVRTVRRPPGRFLRRARYTYHPRPPGNPVWDLACILFCVLLGAWLMFSTLHFQDGNFVFAVKSWSDFGANLSLTQSFALGNNFPPEHPFYPGETVRYHFLFWFLSANLSYLGLNVVWAINTLSVLSLLALIVLLMTFAETLFRSAAVGRIAAVMFFFASSSLSYIPFLRSRDGLLDALRAIAGRTDYLPSGFAYRGDDWGALTVTVFANQRQLLSAVGVVLIVLSALVGFYRSRGALKDVEGYTDHDDDPASPSNRRPIRWADAPFPVSAARFRDLGTMIFCGVLIGALPYWNSAVFVAAAFILGGLFVLFPKRHYVFVCIATLTLIGLPQVLMLRSGGSSAGGYSLFNPGYIVADPTVLKVLGYIGWTFGLKLLLIAVAAACAPAAHRRLMIALTVPFIAVFLLQLSTDVFNNHKLLNIWNVLISVYVAYALWIIGRAGVARTVLAAFLAVAMAFGSVIDLFPVRNDSFVTVPFRNDRLTEWLLARTSPSDIFLTDTLLSHPILFSGRKVFLGNTLFAWTAGYAVAERERLHRRMITMNDLYELRRLLAENDIDYIAYDDGLRSNEFTRGHNEALIRQNFVLVFDDTENRYGHLRIYSVLPPIHGF